MECDLYDFPMSSEFEHDSSLYDDSTESEETSSCDLHEGIHLEMWTPHMRMREVVNVIVALQRLTHWKPRPTEFCPEDMFNHLMENVIEERQMNPLKQSPAYCKTGQVLQCVVCDEFKKTLVRSGGSPRLQAVTLKSGSSELKVQFSLSTYVSPSAGPTSSQPVCLGISKTNLYLACNKSEDSDPHLVLEEINESLNTIQSGDPKEYDSLLFFRKETGTSINTFESVKYPGWFISTSFDDYQLVDMGQLSAERITNFQLKEKVLIRS